MDRIAEMQAAIQQQSQDLRDEVAELRRWEEAVKKRDELLRQKSTAKSLVSDVSTLVPESAPPIRGSAPVTSSTTASSAAPQRDQTQIYKEQGNDYFRMGQFNDAVRAYTKGIDVDPTSSAMHVLYGNRSMCYLKLKEWALAEKDATTCVQMNRTFTKGFYRRALARKELKKYAEARADLETALTLVPNDPDSLRELDEVTALLRSSQPAEQKPKPKRIVIEDDEEEDEVPVESTKDAEARMERQRRDAEELQRREAAVEAARRAQLEKEEQARQRQRRSNARVEIIDEAEAEAPLKQKEPSREPSVEAPHVPAPKKQASPAATRTFAAAKAPLTVERLEKPTRFSEVERNIPDVRADPALLAHYVSLMAADGPKQWAQLFGRSLSDADIIGDIARGGGALAADQAAAVVRGLAAIPNFDEVRLFADATCVDALQQLLRTAKPSLTAADLRQAETVFEVRA